MNEEFRGLVDAMRDCCDKILSGNDPGYIWTTTLHAHAYVMSNDFTIFGTPTPEMLAVRHSVSGIDRASLSTGDAK